MGVNREIDSILEQGEKELAGLTYLYWKEGIPSVMYDVRLREPLDGELLNRAIDDALLRHPYFGVRFNEHDGDFYVVRNDEPLRAIPADDPVPLGGHRNNHHLIGIVYNDASLKFTFHHGLTDGRGAKTFLETMLAYYADYADADEDDYDEVATRHAAQATEQLSTDELKEPFARRLEAKGAGRVEGLATSAFKIPATKKKCGHSRRELVFSQDEFMRVCKGVGASPIIYLSILMSRAVKKVHADAGKPIVSNFAADLRSVIGCERTYKNCVFSMSLPYGTNEETLSDDELVAVYRSLINAQRNYDRCASQANNINMIQNLIGHIDSVAGRRALLGFMESLGFDTYVISYIGQFSLPEHLVSEMHLYHSVPSGLTLNMCCQSGRFALDVVQDFESTAYVEALVDQFERAGIVVEASEQLAFETPRDELSEHITSPATMQELADGWMHDLTSAAKSTADALREQVEAAQPFFDGLAQMVGTGDLEPLLGPTRDLAKEIHRLVEETPSLFMH